MASRTQALSGKDANFLVGRHDYSDIFSMVGLGTTRDKADITTLKDLGKAYVPGHFDGTLRLGGIFSAVEDKVLQSYVDEASAPIICTLILGSEKGDRAKLAQMVASEYAISTPVDDKSDINGSGQASGLMHHCVALTDVDHMVTSPTSEKLNDNGGAAEFIDLGQNHKWRRIRLHVHLLSKGTGLTKFEVKVRSSNATTANAISGAGIVAHNGANGVDITTLAQDDNYVFEITAPEGGSLNRFWEVELNPTGGTARSTVVVAFGRSQE